VQHRHANCGLSNVEYVKIDDIPNQIVQKEKKLKWVGMIWLTSQITSKKKIVQGRIEKRLKEMTLMDQSYIRDQNITVEELVKQSVATLGENIQVRRFVRFVLGEGIEKQESNFAEEVAAWVATKKEVRGLGSSVEIRGEVLEKKVAQKGEG